MQLKKFSTGSLFFADELLEEVKKRTDVEVNLYNLTELRVSHNLNSDLDFLFSEENMLLAEDQEIVAIGDTILSMLELIKALGGGYNACDEEG
jgi:outer membrane protein TolC